MKKNYKSIVEIIFLSLILCVVISVFIIELVKTIKRGWTANDLMNLVFFTCVALVASFSTIMFGNYFVLSDKSIVFINNEIYRKFKLIESKGKLNALCNEFISIQKEMSLEKIKNVLSAKNKELVIIEKTVDSYFAFNVLYKNENPKLCNFKIKRLEKLYSLYKSNISPRYEKLFRDVETKKIIEKPKFPLTESISTITLAMLSIMISFYQSFQSVGKINDSLLSYCFLLLLAIVFALVFSLFFAKTHLFSYKREKNKTIGILQKVLEKEEFSEYARTLKSERVL